MQDASTTSTISRIRHPATLINDEPPCTSRPVCREDQPAHAHWALIRRAAYDTHLRHVAPYAHTRTAPCSRSPVIPGAMRPSRSCALFGPDRRRRRSDVRVKRSYQQDDASSSPSTFYSLPLIPPPPFHPRSSRRFLRPPVRSSPPASPRSRGSNEIVPAAKDATTTVSLHARDGAVDARRADFSAAKPARRREGRNERKTKEERERER